MHAYEPPPLTRLERLFLDAGYDVSDGSFDEQCDRLRAHLRREIAKRVAKTDRVELRCEECHGVFTLSERRARDRVGVRVLCHDCAHPAVLAPSSRDRLWVGKLDRETRETALAGLAALR